MIKYHDGYILSIEHKLHKQSTYIKYVFIIIFGQAL